MKTTLNISETLMKEAMQRSGVETKTETVRLALEGLIKQKKIEMIVAKAGTLNFSRDWEKARHVR
jgi:Arc/MetJ family transcription regulator